MKDLLSYNLWPFFDYVITSIFPEYEDRMTCMRVVCFDVGGIEYISFIFKCSPTSNPAARLNFHKRYT